MEKIESSKGTRAVLRAGGYSGRVHIPAPAPAALRIASAVAAPPVTAQFQVTYHGFSQAAKTAFQAAVDVWAVTLNSSVPIRVDAHWTPLGANILGQAGPETFFRDFAGAGLAGTYYPVAAANKASASDLSPGQPHLTAEFSSNFPNWYFGTDGATPATDYDLMSVVLHELGHGLGFLGSMYENLGQATWGLGTPRRPMIWDRFVVDGTGRHLIDPAAYPNPSAGLLAALQGGQIFFDSPNARAANGGQPAQLYAPATWEPGSSYSHLDETTFASGNVDSLMSPQLGLGEAIHSPGPLTIAMLRDMGW